ncbi:MAG: DUF3300 domain-containing protein [Syntrophobacteraceae bacterium]
MKRNVFLIRALIGILVVMLVPYGAFAQDAGTTGAFSQQELDQMLASIALYPDSLLAQVLIAATYPDQVMEADRWLKENPALKGDPLNTALDGMNWDLSVKALAPFPQVLGMMAKESAWTQRLGEAFLAQQDDVMDSVQRLRQKAYAAGNLKTTAEQKVVVQGESIEVAPVNPEVVYIPNYNPVVVYGPWWYPAYPPFAYYPVFPGVAVGVGVFGFFGAVAVGPVWGAGWGSWGWAHHDINININRNVNINSRHFDRASMRTGSFHEAARGGHIGSERARAGAGARSGAGHTGGAAGHGPGGVTGHGAGGGRPTAGDVAKGLKSGGSKGGTAGGSGGAKGGTAGGPGGGAKGGTTGGGASHGPTTGGGASHGPTTGGSATHGPTTGGGASHGPTAGGGASHGPTAGGGASHGPTVGGKGGAGGGAKGGAGGGGKGGGGGGGKGGGKKKP